LSDVNKYSFLAAIDVDAMTPDKLFKGKKERSSKDARLEFIRYVPLIGSNCLDKRSMKQDI
jgi:hypothetical protein